MKRSYCWERTPGKIIAITKRKNDFGSLHIEAVLQESRTRNDEVEPNTVTILWAYAPVIRTSEATRKNLAPHCFEWAYNFAKEGMEVVIHHCLDDNARYFYYS